MTSEWKPIDQDAHSGKRVLIFIYQPVPTFGGGGVFIARWTDRISARGDDRGRAWFDDTDQEIRLQTTYYRREVTHWMPLPDGPITVAKK